MGAKVIIYGQSLNSHFLRGLTHSALSQMSGIRILISRCLNFDDFFWQSDTKLCWGNEKMVGEMQQFVGEMQHFVGETKQFVGEMKQICWGNEANGWGSEAKCVGEMPRR